MFCLCEIVNRENRNYDSLEMIGVDSSDFHSSDLVLLRRWVFTVVFE